MAEEPVTGRLYSPISAPFPQGSVCVYIYIYMYTYILSQLPEVRYDHLTFFGQSNLNRRDM